MMTDMMLKNTLSIYWVSGAPSSCSMGLAQNKIADEAANLANLPD